MQISLLAEGTMQTQACMQACIQGNPEGYERREKLPFLSNVHPDYKIDEVVMGTAVPTVQIAHNILEKQI